jgi:hypothetical protein
MNRDKEELLERISKCIETIQRIHNDSRTPLEDARNLVIPLRELDRCRDDLRRSVFSADSNSEKFNKAVAGLEKINNTLKADIIAHQRTMEFVGNVADTTSAVLELAIAVAGTVAPGPG